MRIGQMSALSCDVVMVHDLGACAMRREKREKNSIRGKPQLIWIEGAQRARLARLDLFRIVGAVVDLPWHDIVQWRMPVPVVGMIRPQVAEVSETTPPRTCPRGCAGWRRRRVPRRRAP